MRLKRLFLLIIACLTIGWVQAQTYTPSADGVIYVNQAIGTSGNGSSWESAVKDLADVLNDINLNPTLYTTTSEVWVAKGTYTPKYNSSGTLASSSDAREATFSMVSGVSIYGGFAPDATSAYNDKDNINYRNWDKWKTILSGEIGTAVKTDNAYSVVSAVDLTTTTELNGVVITGGYADGNINTNDYCGGGIFISFSNSYLNDNPSTSPDFTYCDNSLYVKNAVITDNLADHGGGVFISYHANPQFVNVLIANNEAIESGGGVYKDASGPQRSAISTCQTVFTNVTIAGNVAGNVGGGIRANSAIYLYNSIVWGNKNSPLGGSLPNDVNGIINSYNSTIGQYHYPEGEENNNNNDSDPEFFGKTNSSANVYDYYRLTSESTAAINTGDNDYYKAAVGDIIPDGEKELAAENRIQGGVIDRGAYELPTCPFDDIPGFNGIVYVKDFSVAGVTGDDGDGSGKDWDNAHPDLAEVLHIARMYPNCIDEIRIAEGTYLPKYDMATNELYDSEKHNPRNRTFVVPDGIVIKGAYPPHATSTGDNKTTDADRDTRKHESILSGDLNGNDNPDGNNSENAYHVVVIPGINSGAGRPYIDGLTVRGGNADAGGLLLSIKEDFPSVYLILQYCGGGIYVQRSSPIIKNVVVTENSSIHAGGGIFANDPFNAAEIGDTPTTDNLIDLINVVIDHNTSFYGAGINNFEVRTLATNLTNVTVANNTAIANGSNPSYGGGLLGAFTLRNSIVWGNTADNFDNVIYMDGGYKSTFYNSLIEGFEPDGNDDWNTTYGTNPDGKFYYSDPEFVSPGRKNDRGQYDYTLKGTSPAIDQGDDDYYETNAGIAPEDDVDAYSRLRKNGESNDLGAVEAPICPFEEIPNFEGIVYVKDYSSETGSGETVPVDATGLSWSKAHPNLAYVMKIANDFPGCIREIRVTEGLYLPEYKLAEETDHKSEWEPSVPTTNRDKTFRMAPGVLVYGGFDPNLDDSDTAEEREAQLKARDFDINPTILSGDLGGNDTGNDEVAKATREDNVYHVVVALGDMAYNYGGTYGTQTARLDGFTVQDGGNNPWLYDTEYGNTTVLDLEQVGGAGIAIYGKTDDDTTITAPRLSNLVIKDNGYARYYEFESESAFYDQPYKGVAGIYSKVAWGSCEENERLIIDNVLITNNKAYRDGVAIFNDGRILEVNNFDIHENTYIYSEIGWIAGILSIGNTFLRNGKITANEGGAITLAFREKGDDVPSKNSTAFNSDLPPFTLTNLTIAENTKFYDRLPDESIGAVQIVYFDETMPNVIQAQINNTIIWGNTVNEEKDPAISYYGKNFQSAPELAVYTDIQNSLIEDSFDDGNVWNSDYGNNISGNIDTDPQFKGTGNTYPYQLDTSSPAVNTGLNSLWKAAGGEMNEDGDDDSATSTEKDLAKEDRIQDDKIDMGAYEAPGCPIPSTIVYVKTESTGDGSGVDWDNAHGDLAYILHIARLHPGCVEEIHIAEGTYLPKYDAATNELYDPENDDHDPRNQSFVIPDGVTIIGSYPKDITEDNKDEKSRNPKDTPSILSGDLDGDGLDNDDAYHVVIIPGTDPAKDAPSIDGVTITGGNANCEGPDCTITVEDKKIPNNVGGGVVITDDAVIKNTTVRDNESDSNGGGIFIDNPTKGETTPTEIDVDLINVIIDHNTSGGNGGGVHNNDSTEDNKTNVTLTNVTVADNEAANGGGISGEMDVNNSIIWGNTDTTSGTDTDNVYNGKNNNVENSIIGGSGGSRDWNPDFGTNNDNNLDVNPQFKDANPESGDPQDRDYGLKPDSPAIDTGSNDIYKDKLEQLDGVEYDDGIPTDEIDAYGNPRVDDEIKIINRGAVENPAVCPFTSPIVYVKDYTHEDAPDEIPADADGSTWEKAHPDLAYVLRIAVMYPGCIEVIKIAEGTHYPKYDPETGGRYEPGDENTPREVTFEIPDEITIEGGYPADADNSTDEDDRNPREHETILTGDIGDPKTDEEDNDDDNSYHVIVIPGDGNDDTKGPVIDGITVKDGNADCKKIEDEDCTMKVGDKEIPTDKGGGIIVDDSDPVIKNTTVTENNSEGGGGGLYGDNSSTIELINVVIDHNTTNGNGGGILNGDPDYTTINMTNVTVADNKVLKEDGKGGGISGPVNMVNTIVWGNTDTTEGTATDNINDGTTNRVENSLIEGADTDGNGTWNKDYGTGFEDPDNNNERPESPNVFYDFEPEFVRPDSKDEKDQYDYTLGISSPAIDQGNNDLYVTAANRIEGTNKTVIDDITGTLSKDAYWNPRVIFDFVDLGAVESRNYCPPILVWIGGTAGKETDWHTASNWYPARVPQSCTDVYITGKSVTGASPYYFPLLTTTTVEDIDNNSCARIFFMPGAQLGRPDLLSYTEAHVEIDYGKGSLDAQAGLEYEDLVDIGRDAITSENRVAFGAEYSNATLAREEWHMLSAPLKSIFTGDFGFGGFPMSFIRKFDSSTQTGGNGAFSKGGWYDYSNEGDHGFDLGQGFGHFLYGMADDIWSLDNNELWTGSILDSHGVTAPTPAHIDGKTAKFGLAHTNGIIQFPMYDDEYLSKARRNHEYSNGTSTFHTFWQYPATFSNFYGWTSETHTASRSKGDRFIFEDNTTNKPLAESLLTFNAGTATGEEQHLLIGNPFMSGLDVAEFLKVNSNINKTVGCHVLIDGSYVTRTTGHIAPMQSFIVEVVKPIDKDTPLNIKFTYAMAAASTKDEAMLKSQVAPKEILTLTARNKEGATTAYIAHSESASDSFCNDDLTKIINSPMTGKHPEVYSLAFNADNKAVGLAINTVQSDELFIPLGIITTYKGETSIELSGLDAYPAEVIFIDTEEGVQKDITDMESFVYSFNYTPVVNDKGEAQANESRFMLQLLPKDMTNIDGVEGNNQIAAYVNNGELVVTSASALINQVSIYNAQGVLISEANNVEALVYKQALSLSGVYVVKVQTTEGRSEVKVIRQ